MNIEKCSTKRERAKCGSIAYTWKITDNDENSNHIENEIKTNHLRQTKETDHNGRPREMGKKSNVHEMKSKLGSKSRFR